MSLLDDLRSYLAPRTDAAPSPAPVSARADGWSNLTTGLGVEGRDASIDTSFYCQLIPRPVLTEVYRCSGIAAKVIERPAVDATRMWVKFEAGDSDEESAEFDEAVQEDLKRLDAQWAMTMALIWARLYGAGMILVHFENEDPSEPIPESGPLRRIERLEARPGGWNSYFFPMWEDDAIRDCESIQGYTYQPPYGVLETWHADRVIRIDQTFLPERELIEQYCWTDGIMPRIWDALRDEGTAYASAGQYLQDRQYSVWKIKGLLSKVMGSGLDALTKRYQAAIYGRSKTRAIALDYGQEELEDRTLSVGGLSDLLEVYPQRVSAVSSIPMTLLYGTSPDGMNATGASDIRLYYDYVSATIQEFQLRPALHRLVDLVLRQIDGPGERDRWRMEFESLWQLTELEKAQVYETNARADVAYVNASVLMPEEVATSRFGGAEYGKRIYLDEETREMMVEDTQPESVPGEEPPPGEEPSAGPDADDLEPPTDVPENAT